MLPQMYVDLDTMDVVSRDQILKKFGGTKKKGELLTTTDLVMGNAAMLSEVTTGEVFTGKAEWNPNFEGGVYQRVYRDRTKEENLVIAKSERELGKFLPLTVTMQGSDRTFDMNKQSQDNINNTIDAFEEVRAEFIASGWVDDGTLPWVLSDNSVFPVTLADLKAVKVAATVRAAKLHAQYNALK